MSFINDAKSKLKQNLIDLLAISGIPHKISSETLAVIQCPKCSNFSAHLSLYNGWLYCSNCKCVINYRALAKQLGFEMKTRKNQGDFGMFSEHLGVFGKFKNPSQLEIERFVFESHSRLMNDEEMLQIVCERTNLHKESVKAYKIGLITGAGQCPFFICQNRDHFNTILLKTSTFTHYYCANHSTVP